MTTDALALAEEVERVTFTLRRTVEAGRDAAPMVAAFGNGRRRWTVMLNTGGEVPDPEPLEAWLRDSATDSAVVGMDMLTRTVDPEGVDAYLAETRPREDPEAAEALVVGVFVRVAPGVAGTLLFRTFPYGRADDGTVEWGNETVSLVGEAPPVGGAVGPVLRGLAARGENRSADVIRRMVEAGCVVVDAKGRTRSP